ARRARRIGDASSSPVVAPPLALGRGRARVASMRRAAAAAAGICPVAEDAVVARRSVGLVRVGGADARRPRARLGRIAGPRRRAADRPRVARGVSARPGAVAAVGRARIAVVLARGPGRVGAPRAGGVARTLADRPAGARIAGMDAAAARAAGVGAVAEQAVVARRRVERMDALPGTVAPLVRALLPVRRARAARLFEAAVRSTAVAAHVVAVVAFLAWVENAVATVRQEHVDADTRRVRMTRRIDGEEADGAARQPGVELVPRRAAIGAAIYGGAGREIDRAGSRGVELDRPGGARCAAHLGPVRAAVRGPVEAVERRDGEALIRRVRGRRV